MNRILLKQASYAAILYVVFISSLWFYLYIPTQKLQDSWEQELEEYVERSNQLTALIDDFGYGGFIDGFSLFLRTKDIVHLERTIETLDIMLLRLNRLKELSDENKEALLIKTITQVVKNYRLTAETLKNNLAYSAVMSYAILKRKITRQDPAILTTLDTLVQINGHKLEEVKEKTAGIKHAHDKALLYWCIGASIFYFFSAAVTLYFYRYFKRTFNQLECIYEQSPIATLLFDDTGRVLQVNKAFRSMFAIDSADSVAHIPMGRLLPGVFEGAEELHKVKHLEDKVQVMNFIIDANRIDSTVVPVEVSVSLIELDGENVAFALISDKSKEVKLQKKARTDGLTKVFNRGYGEELLQMELDRMRRTEQMFSVLLIDVDYFKKVNDTLGHNVGDNLLKAIVKMFKKTIRKTDLIARWGGDEFVVILPDTNYEFATEVAGKLVDLAHYAFTKQDESIRTSISIGVAMAEKGDNVISLINKADEALYETKLHGRNGYTLHSKIGQ
jgi:diguanylate cyclase (GGDEF)-like protein/PAS domain S-box-containing protein